MKIKIGGRVKFSDNYDSADTKDEIGNKVTKCMVRHAKIFITDPKKSKDEIKSEYNIPYGANVLVDAGENIKPNTNKRLNKINKLLKKGYNIYE